jgi:hypothetical protein
MFCSYRQTKATPQHEPIILDLYITSAVRKKKGEKYAPPGGCETPGF